ncbi:MAG TPA: copper oxidase [Sulfurovum sp.]|nr:copper oxidase [Sulfurovum sp.]
MERREFLTLSGAAAVALLTGCGGGGGGNDAGSTLTPIAKSLPIPPSLTGTGAGTASDPKVYELRVQSSSHDFFHEGKTATYAVNGTFLGPTLFLRDGEDVSIKYENTLSETISMHGHGMHLPANMDGSAWQNIAAGTTWSAKYTVNQKACTNWYHPHTLKQTSEQVYKGIAGMIIIEDAESDALDLPKRYGIDDIPLVLQDRKFDNAVQLLYSPNMHEVMTGYIGDTFLANGAIEPTFDAEAKEIRFRILNGSNSSMYKIGFSDGRAFKQIATDNAFLESPVSMTSLVLSPAERAEIVVDLSGDIGKSIELKEFLYNKTFVKINVSKSASATTTLPSALTTLTRLVPPSTVTRTFTLEASDGNFTINNKVMDLNRIDETVYLDDIELWEITNTMGVNHNFHMHGTHFQLISRNGNTSIPANEDGYKDTVWIPADESVQIVVKMTDYTDITVPYMYHCHFLEHEDRGMMGQFIVR